jgi:hypothetical protein
MRVGMVCRFSRGWGPLVRGRLDGSHGGTVTAHGPSWDGSMGARGHVDVSREDWKP